ncbi:ABC transporter permease [Schleiferilactobacillus shenzhenensis]|uniref:ABC transmembrane type-2 domain-containing protein n=1 Tax=Schleiferilactobacillus shenzhenensis LY-73 TaxID=1231336 RepID=U4TQ94_9LACO|nr:ABC transporter permease [Schleiferilactobacillus shenzhenensis]ERL64073.1 hypothetical protein L248_1606 [Schleiferilactobacillus shenzhenensis LY-73]
MRIGAMIKRIMLELSRDKRTLGLLFIAPLFILTLMYFLFQSNTTQQATLAVRGVDSTLVQAIDNKHIQIRKVTDTTVSARRLIRQHDYAGVLTQSGSKLTLTLQNSDQTQSALIKQSLQAAQIQLKMKAAGTTIKTQAAALQKLARALAAATRRVPTASAAPAGSHTAAYSLTTHYLYGSGDATFFQTLLPIMIGFVVFFFVFLISGIALLRERTTGTLNRLLATPVRRGEIIAGYLCGYGLLALVQTILVVLFTLYVFNIQILGNLALVLLINILLAIIALTLGLLISTFTSSEFQMVQFIPIVVIPQIFFSGLIPVNQMAGWLQAIAHVMPLYYGADAMSAVIEKGAAFSAIAGDVGILLLFFAVFLGLNLLAMRRYRQV